MARWSASSTPTETCEPRVFAELCRAIESHDADVAIGSRMGSDSRMPAIRMLGNTLFALLLGLLSRRPVGDTASGMRVIRRDRLPRLYPLPDGLQFTPAMSARVLMEDRLRLVEIPMPYAERVGRSKLSVVRDGVRFLTVILQAATCYRPARPLLVAATPLVAATALLAFGPVAMYLREGRIEEWMIYRVLLASLLVTGVGPAAVRRRGGREHLGERLRSPARPGWRGGLGLAPLHPARPMAGRSGPGGSCAALRRIGACWSTW